MKKKNFLLFCLCILCIFKIQSRIVSIPVTNLKTYLLGNTLININKGAVIQNFRASNFNKWINCIFNNNDSISPSGNDKIFSSNNKTYSITQDANYNIADVWLDDISVGDISTCATNKATSTNNIAASFVANCVTTFGTINQSICAGSSYTFNGIGQTTTGVYYDTLVNADGCDSVLTLNLNIIPNSGITSVIATPSSICAGDSLMLSVITPIEESIVSTFAGNGVLASIDGIGTAASIGHPYGIVIDSLGNVYVGDNFSNTIRKITPSGVVTTLAGSGFEGSADGIGTAASFRYPSGLTIDSNGSLYVSDRGNQKIRKITPAGLVSTLAGSGAVGANDGIGTLASFEGPIGLSTDTNGNVYVTDNVNNKIRKVSPSGVVSTYAGNGATGYVDGPSGSALFTSPYDVTVDSIGNVFVADHLNDKIRKITPAGIVSTFAGFGGGYSVDGPIATASLHTPGGITIDSKGNFYITESGYHKIRKISPTGIVSTLAGNGMQGDTDGAGSTASFNFPYSIAVDSNGIVFVVDVLNHKIRKIIPAPPLTFSWSPSNLVLNASSQITQAFPSANTIYTVTVSNSNGCTSTGTVMVNVNASYTINASAGSNGSISPSGNDTICNGNNRTYTITPDANYNISAVLVDGINVGPVTSYTFNNVTATHTIAASFVANCVTTFGIINQSICADSIYTFNGIGQTTTGVYYDTLINAGGCDSILTLNLTVIPPIYCQAPTLGNYPNINIVSGQNTSNTPSTVPSNAASIVAYTNTNFTGILVVDPITGVVNITDAKQAGTFTVTVKANNAGSLSTFTTFTLTVVNPNCSVGLFGNIINTAVGNTPYGISIGDFNNDGNQDIAVANANNASVSIKLGNGSGGLLSIQPSDLLVNSGPFNIAIGDFNGDGNQDIATANNYAYTVSIRLGNGDGTFSGNTNLNVGVQPEFVALGDFNNDGKQDIAVSNFEDDNISIRIGDGNGGFTSKPDVGVGIAPIGIIIGDFNKDGFQDIASANWNGNNVSIRFGDGTGLFTSLSNYNLTVVSNPNSIAIGDFNQDGNQDFVLCGHNEKAAVYLGNASGLFGSGIEYTIGATPYGVAVGDFNGDGHQDFIIADYNINYLPIFLGNGLGTFSTGTNVSIGVEAIAVAVGDFNNDHTQDISTANFNANNASIAIGNVANAEINVTGNNISILDADITPDLADHTDFGNTIIGTNLVRTFTIQNTGISNLIIPIGGITLSGVDASLFSIGGIALPVSITANGSATFTVTFTPTTQGLKYATVNILNNDCDEGTYDFALQGTGVILSLGNYPNTSLIAGTNTTVIPDAIPINALSTVAFTNTNFTGTLSINPITGILTVTDAKQAGIYVVTLKAFGISGLSVTKTFMLTVTNPNCSQGLFTNVAGVSVGGTPLSIVIGDFNGDSKQDLAVANYGSQMVSIRFGDGIGGFSVGTDLNVGASPTSIAVGDFNGDGKQDMAITKVSNNVSIQIGNGSGGFIGGTDVSVGNNPNSVAIGDFNGDGKQDIAVSHAGNAFVSVRLGDGNGGFLWGTNVNVASVGYSVAVGDFNNDGKQDLVTANYVGNNVSIRFGNGSGGFTGTTNIGVGNNPNSVAVGDFNNDGNQDIAIANNNSSPGIISILKGNGNGSFIAVSNVTTVNFPNSVAVGDFNGDGKQDIAATSYYDNAIAISFGNSVGFGLSSSISVTGGQHGIAIGDFNGDGKQDFAGNNTGYFNVFIRLGIANEINVKGNNIPIIDGDITPSTTDHTDFGNVNPGSNLIRTYTIQNTGTSSLTVSSITKTGSDAGLFTIGALSPASPIAAGGSATFAVTFAPTSLGVKNATITINNNDCDEAVYDFAIKGNCTCTGSPIITCTNFSANTSIGQCTATVTFSPSIIGLSTLATTYVFTGATSGSGNGTGSGSVFNKGVTNVLLTVSDLCGSAMCSFTITVNDIQLPTLACPINQTLNVIANTCAANYVIADPLSDNCTGATWSYSLSGATTLATSAQINDGTNSGAISFNKGTTTVTLHGIDASNNNAVDCSFTVTVNDNQAPTLNCPSSQSLNVIANTCAATYVIADPISDNCTGATWSYTLSGATSGSASLIPDGSGSGMISFNKGLTTVSLHGTDGTNNAAICNFNVTVLDNENPIAICQPITLTLDAQGQASLLPSQVNNNSTDNCGIAGMALSKTNFDCSDIVANNALSFNSSLDRVVTNSIANIPIGNSERTFSMWINCPSINTSNQKPKLITHGNNSIVGGKFELNLSNGNHLEFTGGNNDYLSSLIVPINTWTFIAITYNGGNNYTLYMNANSESFNLAPSNTLASKLTLADTTIVVVYQNGLTFYHPIFKIDEVQVFNKALTATELASVRLGGNPAPINRVLYFPFNEGSGITITDAAGSNHSSILNPSGINWVNCGPSQTGLPQSISLIVTDSSGNNNQCNSEVRILDPNPGVYLAAKVMLSGPYNATTGLMNDNLRTLNLIPNLEPYSSGPYFKLYTYNERANHETVSSSVLATSGPNAIVDWVFLELRSATNASTVLYTKRALVQRDGDIVSHTDGVSPVYFKDVPFNTSYYLSVKHRNHLGVMSAFPVYLTNCRGNNASVYNFSTDSVKIFNAYVSWPTFPTPPQPPGSYPYYARKVIQGIGAVPNIKALWSGDAYNNKNVKYNGIANDKDAILNSLGGPGNSNATLNNVYRMEDLNMDGKIRFNGTDNDRLIIIENIGTTLQNNIIFQQTPN